MRLLLLIGSLFFMMSCSSTLDDYKQTTPVFDLFNYFNGNTQAWGTVHDYKNKQTRRFFVTIKGTVEKNQLTLEEHFTYDDGEKQQRTWHISKQPDGTYQGTANDINGLASGSAEGNAFNWHYNMDITTNNSVVNLTFDDWLYQQDETHLFNITHLKKWGFTVGRVTLFFEKLPVTEQTP